MFGGNIASITALAVFGLLVTSTGYPSFAGGYRGGHICRAAVFHCNSNINNTINTGSGVLTGRTVQPGVGYGIVLFSVTPPAGQEQQDPSQYGDYSTPSEPQQLETEPGGLQEQIIQDYNP